MKRGTTPTLTFTLPFQATTITTASLVFVQGDTIVLEKDEDDLTASGTTLTLTLTEAETLAFDTDEAIKIQLRCAVTGGSKMASQIITTYIGAILKDGEL